MDKEWKKNPKWGVRLNNDKLPDFTYVDQWYEGTLIKRNMLQLVYPNSPSFGGLKWKVFETKELAEEWIKNPIIPKVEPKQETLEEVNWKSVYEDSLNMQKCSNAGYESKIVELKSEIKRSYSEKESLTLLNEYNEYLFSFIDRDEVGIGTEKEDVKKWFELNKIK
jgi:hypothetical protein